MTVPGDKTNFRCVGIHDIDEVFLGESSLTEALDGPFGVDVGNVEFNIGMPAIPLRNHLSIFRFAS
jgi:hypothetical protein